MQLDKFQKNDVFLAITEAGLAPDRFELSFDPLEGKTLLGHTGSSAFITIESTDYENLWIEYRVADGPLQSSMHEEDGWLPPVENWLALLKRDLETPDLWATLQQQQTMLDSPSVDANANTPFTAEEQQQIHTQLGEIKAYAKETNKLSGDQMRLLEGQLNYLHDAASRMGRIDWRNAVTGVLLGTVVNAVLPGEVARDALLMLLRSVGHMFGHPIPELSLGL